jgi:hypothetical protein
MAMARVQSGPVPLGPSVPFNPGTKPLNSGELMRGVQAAMAMVVRMPPATRTSRERKKRLERDQ